MRKTFVLFSILFASALVACGKYPSARQAYEACQTWKAKAGSVEIDYSAEQKREEQKREEERKSEERKRREEEAKKRIKEEVNSSTSLPASQNDVNPFKDLYIPDFTDQEMRDMRPVGTIIRKCEPEDQGLRGEGDFGSGSPIFEED